MWCHVGLACPDLGTLGHRIVPSGDQEEAAFSTTMTVCGLPLSGEWATTSGKMAPSGEENLLNEGAAVTQRPNTGASGSASTVHSEKGCHATDDFKGGRMSISKCL